VIRDLFGAGQKEGVGAHIAWYQVFKVMKKWNFIYVENFAWVKKSVNNKFVTQPYKYFQKSKTTLLIFRKFTVDGKVRAEFAISLD
jgi:hypothetical protein